MLKGELGFPLGGFPRPILEAVLKSGKKSPSSSSVKIDIDESRAELEKKLKLEKDGQRTKINETDLLSYIMHPKSALDFFAHRIKYGNTAVVPTPIFFFGMHPGEETEIQIEEGKVLYIKFIAVSDVDAHGMRTVFFELNGRSRDVRIQDASKSPAEPKRQKADPGNLHHLAAPMPGLVINVFVNPGEKVRKGDKLFLLEAMKMETTVLAQRSGVIDALHVKAGDQIATGDLILSYE